MQLLASRIDLERFGLPQGWLAAVGDEELEATLSAASAIAAGYLATKYQLPLLSWGDDLRRAVCHIACWDLMCKQGFDPESPSDRVVQQRSDDAIRWLREIAAGRVDPPDLKDSTPDNDEGGSFVASEPPRSW